MNNFRALKNKITPIEQQMRKKVQPFTENHHVRSKWFSKVSASVAMHPLALVFLEVQITQNVCKKRERAKHPVTNPSKRSLVQNERTNDVFQKVENKACHK